jgi:integrase
MVGKKLGAHQEKRLTALHLRKPAPGRHADGNGLYLEVEPNGAARWMQRLVIQGKRRDMGLGGLSLVSLAEARDKALENRRIARAGGDPIARARAAKAMDADKTFRDAALECHAMRAKKWRNEKHAGQWLSTLEAYAFPTLGNMRVSAIGSADVMAVLTPIWTDKPETARRVRHRVGLVLDYARAKGWRAEGSPTQELSRALPKMARIKRHQPAMPYAEVPGFIAALRASDSREVTKDALEFLIICAARTGEVLGARWSEIDLAKAVWTVPGDRMKAGKPHAVPLTQRAVDILSARKEAHSGVGGYVFESKPGKPLSQQALLMVMRRMKLDYVPHGFRSSFRVYAAEKSNLPREVAEAALAHSVGNAVEAAYRRTDLFEKRRKLMTAWTAWCGGGASVVSFANARRARPTNGAP